MSLSWSEPNVTSVSSAVLLQTTGLVGLAVSHNPHEVSGSQWTHHTHKRRWLGEVTLRGEARMHAVIVHHSSLASPSCHHVTPQRSRPHLLIPPTNVLLFCPRSVWSFSTQRSWRRCRPCHRMQPTGSTRSSWSMRGLTTSKWWVEPGWVEQQQPVSPGHISLVWPVITVI